MNKGRLCARGYSLALERPRSGRIDIPIGLVIYVGFDTISDSLVQNDCYYQWPSSEGTLSLGGEHESFWKLSYLQQ